MLIALGFFLFNNKYQMEDPNKLKYFSDQYTNMAQLLILHNGKRCEALGKLVETSYWSMCLPKNNFSRVPEDCISDFNILIKWQEKIDKKIFKLHNEIDKTYTDSELRQNEKNKIGLRYVVSKMHMSPQIEKVLCAIYSISMTLYRISNLPNNEKNKIRFVKI